MIENSIIAVVIAISIIYVAVTAAVIAETPANWPLIPIGVGVLIGLMFLDSLVLGGFVYSGFEPWGAHLVAVSEGDFTRPVISEHHALMILEVYGWYIFDVAILYAVLAFVLLQFLGKSAVVPLALIFLGIAVIFGAVMITELGYAGASVLEGLGWDSQGISPPHVGDYL